jgi:ABC-2 type transport system ATP-binding protein
MGRINRSVDPGLIPFLVRVDPAGRCGRPGFGGRLTYMPTPAIEVDDLHKSYGSTHAVGGVTFSIDQGEIFGILGPNGAGKTTTVECVEGLRVPDAGSVRVFGHDPHTDRSTVTAVLGAQLQESQLQNKITVAEAMQLFASFYPAPADWHELLERLGMGGQLTQRFAKLSGGQKQRLSIALALVGQPKVVVLDELTTGLDPGARRETWSLVEDIRNAGVTVLLVTHFMEEAERLCDRVIVIDNADGTGGRIIAAGSPSELAGSATDTQVITFVPSAPIELAEIRALPAVRSVEQNGARVTVAGSDAAITELISALARAGVVAQQLRVQQANLDDAFVRLTDHTAAGSTAPAAASAAASAPIERTSR